MYNITEFDQQTMDALAPAEKIGLVASVSPEGLPHITLITSIAASGPKQLTLGEFCKGRSKTHIQKHPEIAFLVLTMDRKMWRGHARWTHLRQEGPEYERYNELPMFRYNAYFGINTVHYLDLVDLRGPDGLPLFKIIISSLMTRIAKKEARFTSKDRVLTDFGKNLFNRMDSLKFMAYIRADGFPEIVPLLQCQAEGSARLVFSPWVFKKELEKIPHRKSVAVFGLTMKMEDVLVRGVFNKMSRSRGIQTGSVTIDWVYNSMPPCHGRIYPPIPLSPVTEFADF